MYTVQNASFKFNKLQLVELATDGDGPRAGVPHCGTVSVPQCHSVARCYMYYTVSTRVWPPAGQCDETKLAIDPVQLPVPLALRLPVRSPAAVICRLPVSTVTVPALRPPPRGERPGTLSPPA